MASTDPTAALRDGLILAIDPGVIKVGWAIVDFAGRPVGQGIVPTASWDTRLPIEARLEAVTQIVVGDGTNLVNTEPILRRLLPEVPVAVVDERGSSVEGWTLKAADYAGGNPFRRFWITVRQLFDSGAIDDYAARVLALRFIQKASTAGSSPAVDK